MRFYILVGLTIASGFSQTHEKKINQFHHEYAPVRTDEQQLFIAKVKGKLDF